MEDTVEDTEDMRTGVFPINGSAQLVSVGGLHLPVLRVWLSRIEDLIFAHIRILAERYP